MSLRVSNVTLGVTESEHALPERLARVLEIPPANITSWRILRKSLDARDRRDLKFVYSAEVRLAQEDELRLLKRAQRRQRTVQIELFHETPFTMPTPGAAPLKNRPVVVGSGPAGLVAAYFLAAAGYAPLVLERGRAVRDRIRDVRALEAGGPHDPESNYLFGEGGAGTFSDGKLTTRSSGPDTRRVLELFAECKGKPSVIYEHRPHLGSNRLPAVVKALRRKIEALGGEVRFECRLENLTLDGTALTGLATSSGFIPAEAVVLAIGHSARDTYAMLLNRGVPMVQKAFQFGVRIEQPQRQVNLAQYGSATLEEHLGAADYALVAHGPPDVFTFCMCAGGQVIPSVSEPGYFATNGMSLSRRDSPFANSGLMVTLEPEAFGGSHTLAGVELQRRFESTAFAIGRSQYLCPLQGANDFLAQRPSSGKFASSYARGVVLSQLDEVIPPLVATALRRALPQLDRRWHGQFLAEATLVGPESRGSAPVRILRDTTTLESTGIGGLYPVGEGAGFAGGIVSAGIDGLRAAKAIAARYAPLQSSAPV